MSAVRPERRAPIEIGILTKSYGGTNLKRVFSFDQHFDLAGFRRMPLPES